MAKKNHQSGWNDKNWFAAAQAAQDEADQTLLTPPEAQGPDDPRDAEPDVHDRIADRNEAVYEAAGAMTEALSAFVLESSSHLTCTEYEAVLDVYRALGLDVSIYADSDHVREDVEDDQHYDPQYDETRANR